MTPTVTVKKTTISCTAAGFTSTCMMTSIFLGLREMREKTWTTTYGGDNRFPESSLNQLKRYVETDNDETSPDAFYARSNQIGLSTLSFNTAKVQIGRMIDIDRANAQNAMDNNRRSEGLTMDQRRARDEADSEDEYEHTANFVENVTPTEKFQERVAIVPVTEPWRGRWPVEWKIHTILVRPSSASLLIRYSFGFGYFVWSW